MDMPFGTSSIRYLNPAPNSSGPTKTRSEGKCTLDKAFVGHGGRGGGGSRAVLCRCRSPAGSMSTSHAKTTSNNCIIGANKCGRKTPQEAMAPAHNAVQSANRRAPASPRTGTPGLYTGQPGLSHRERKLWSVIVPCLQANDGHFGQPVSNGEKGDGGFSANRQRL